MKKRIKEKKRVSKSGALTSAVFGMCVSSAILLALLIMFSLIGLVISNPHSLITPFSFFSIYASSFFGGFISAKKNKCSDALLCGLICGCFVFLLFSSVFWIFGLIIDVKSAPISWLFRAIMIISSILGAILSTLTKSKSPKKKRRR